VLLGEAIGQISVFACASMIASALRFCEPLVDMEPAKSSPAADAREQRALLVGVDAELLGAATHLHARGAQLESRVHAQRRPWGVMPNRSPAWDRARQFAPPIRVEDDACGGQRALLPRRSLPGPAKLMLSALMVVSRATINSLAEATSSPSTSPAMCCNHCRHRGCLDGVMQITSAGRCRAGTPPAR